MGVTGNPLTSNMDVICGLANFVEDAQYLYFAVVSRKFKAAWGKRPTETSIVNRTTSAAQLQYSFKCGVDPRASSVFEAVARKGGVRLLKRAKQKGGWSGLQTCNAAALTGRLDLLKWARANGCRWDATTCKAAASGGNLDILQWLRKRGCQWDSRTCTTAAFHGHLHVLRWARSEKHCPWDNNTVRWAYIMGHRDCYDWARENGCPRCSP